MAAACHRRLVRTHVSRSCRLAADACSAGHPRAQRRRSGEQTNRVCDIGVNTAPLQDRHQYFVRNGEIR